MAEIEFRQQRGAQPKEEGTDRDADLIVAGLRAGDTWEQACARVPVRIMPDWLKRNRPLFEKWAKEGRPRSQDNISGKAKKPTDHIVKDGKVFAIYADGTMQEIRDTTPGKK